MAFAKIRPRRSTRVQWESINPILEEGELGIEYPDTGIGTGLCKFKLGDGFTKWTELPYAFDGNSAGVNGGNVSLGNDIILRTGTTTEWENSNPVLKKGEIVFNSTLGSFKIGDGKTNFKNLDYFHNDISNEKVRINDLSQSTVYTNLKNCIDGLKNNESLLNIISIIKSGLSFISNRLDLLDKKTDDKFYLLISLLSASAFEGSGVTFHKAERSSRKFEDFGDTPVYTTTINIPSCESIMKFGFKIIIKFYYGEIGLFSLKKYDNGYYAVILEEWLTKKQLPYCGNLSIEPTLATNAKNGAYVSEDGAILSMCIVDIPIDFWIAVNSDFTLFY